MLICLFYFTFSQLYVSIMNLNYYNPMNREQDILTYILKVCGIFIISLFFILILSNITQFINIFNKYNKINKNIGNIEIEIKNKDLESLIRESKQLNNNLKIAKENLDNIRFIQTLPYIKENILSANDLISIGISATNIVINSEDIIKNNKTLIDSYKNNTLNISDPKTIKQILEIINSNKNYIDYVEKNVNTIQEKIDNNKSKTKILPKLKSSWKVVIDNYSKIETIAKYIPAIKEAPSILGLNKNARYLLLLENNTELRATGGFIGTYGILTIKNGEIVDIFTDNIYNLDSRSYNRLKIKPPEFLQKYLNIKYLYLRDSNYNPDYKISAKYAEELYKKESLSSTDVDGVIAITPDILKDLLNIFGNIKIDQDTFTPENVINLLNYETKFGYWEKQISTSDRKDIIQKMVDIIFEKIKNTNLKDLYPVIIKNLEEKNVLLYFNNENMQKFVEDKNWGGTVKQNIDSDYLAVVDSNLLSGKNDPYVKRDIDYTLNIDNKKITATLSLTYTFKFVDNGIYKDIDAYLDNYKTYTRIYVPKDSWLISATKDDQEINNKDIDFTIENEKTSFGIYLVIPQGKTVTYTFQYYLPDELSKKLLNKYSFDFQKQPGIYGNNINFNINLGKPIKNLDVQTIENNEIKYKTFQQNISITGLNKGDINVNATFLNSIDMQKIIKKAKGDYLSFDKN